MQQSKAVEEGSLYKLLYRSEKINFNLSALVTKQKCLPIRDLYLDTLNQVLIISVFKALTYCKGSHLVLTKKFSYRQPCELIKSLVTVIEMEKCSGFTPLLFLSAPDIQRKASHRGNTLTWPHVYRQANYNSNNFKLFTALKFVLKSCVGVCLFKSAIWHHRTK